MPVYKKHNGKPVMGYTASELGYTDTVLNKDENNPARMFWYYQKSDGTAGEPMGVKAADDMLHLMGYQKAKDIRKQSFANRMAQNLIAGGGIGESLKKTISEKSKARMMGIKEAFDPLNMVKKLTGGSRLATSLFGKMTNRSKEHLEYFAGDPKKRKLSQSATTGIDPETLQSSTECLGRIYELLKQDKEQKDFEREKKKSFGESIEKQEELRNEELVKALTGRRKKKEEKPYRDEKGRFAKRPTEESPKTTTKPTEAPKTTTKPTEAPKTTTKPTEAPSVFKPNPARTTTPVPKVPTVASTATKVPTPTGMLKYGYLTAAGLAAVTSAHEGNAESVYGDYKDKKTGEMRNQWSDRPPEWSEKNVGKRKNLTDFTFSELLQYQKYRNSIKESSGAVGIAGFMPSTLFGQQLDGKVGLFKQSGLSWNDRFTEDNQKLLKGVLDEADDKILGPGLKRLGVNTGITPGIKIASNYVGASGLLWVIEEGQKDPTISVKDALIKRDPKHRDPTRGDTINKDLATTLAKDFIEKKEQFAIKKATQMGLVNNAGNEIDSASKENKDLKQTSKNDRPSISVNNNVNATSQSPTESSGPMPDDRSAYQKKVKGN